MRESCEQLQIEPINILLFANINQHVLILLQNPYSIKNKGNTHENNQVDRTDADFSK